MELLSDESDAVAVRAAHVISRITEHSFPARARLQASPVIGVGTSISKVMLNPIQEDFITAGAVQKLVPWLVSSIPQKSDAASTALANITSYNLDGKIACLTALVEVLVAGQYQYLPAFGDIVDGIELSSSSEALEIVQKVLEPVVQALSVSRGRVAQDAIAVVGTLCEKSPKLAEMLQQVATDPHGNMLALVVSHLLNGPLQTQDLAARALWFLTSGDVEFWGPEGQAGSQVVPVSAVLQTLIEKNEQQDQEEEENENRKYDNNNFDNEDNNEYLQRNMPSAAVLRYARTGSSDLGGDGSDTPAATSEEICYADEAGQLLAAIAECRPELQLSTGQSKASCCIM